MFSRMWTFSKMPDDLNLSSVEALELNDAECPDDIGVNAEEDDYDPPLPYDYREQWAENPVEWALSYADDLIRRFECGPDFYRSLDSAIIEQWLFEDYPDLRETLSIDGAMNAFRIGLVQRCRMHQAAAMLASMFVDVPIGAVRPVDSLIAACEEFFPGWLSIIMTEPRWKWSATLPGPIAELRRNWPERESLRAHDSGRRVPYSRRSDWLCIDAMDDGQHGVTAYLLEGPTFPASMRWCTRERCALAVHAPAGATVESLAGWDGVALAVSGDGQQASLDLSFGLGTLSLSATEHGAVLLRFRNRVPVVYMLEGEHLLVEYEWNPIAFGREYLRLARETRVVSGVADLPPHLTGRLREDTIRIDRIWPAKLKTFQDGDDDSIPF
ncbi:hypothetical protein SAMN04487926_14541 [Paraburkholderia steynii]|uniref:Uncharacterized protein n=1 Tax=Paraburkholderia steynii TaxID=1245441 RepID=A0A7Z7BKT9_9BURK|nr:hypothetical protein [Paraburkholderia steynii]SDJ36689.1 hypothetical protein SAMN04487926_14541 [Paraburkholderia steynii]